MCASIYLTNTTYVRAISNTCIRPNSLRVASTGIIHIVPTPRCHYILALSRAKTCINRPVVSNFDFIFVIQSYSELGRHFALSSNIPRIDLIFINPSTHSILFVSSIVPAAGTFKSAVLLAAHPHFHSRSAVYILHIARVSCTTTTISKTHHPSSPYSSIIDISLLSS